MLKFYFTACPLLSFRVAPPLLPADPTEDYSYSVERLILSRKPNVTASQKHAMGVTEDGDGYCVWYPYKYVLLFATCIT